MTAALVLRRDAGAAAVRLLILSAAALVALLGIRFFTPAKPAATPPASPAASAPALRTGPQTAPAAPASAPAVLQAPPTPDASTAAARSSARTLEFDNGFLYVDVTSRGARVRSMRLRGFSLDADASDLEKQDPKRCLQLVYHSGQPVSALSCYVSADHASSAHDVFKPLLGVLETADWTLEPIAATADAGPGVTWRLETGGLEVVKRFRLDPRGYHGELTLELSTRDPRLDGFLKLMLVPGGWVFSDHDTYFPSPMAIVGRGAADDPQISQKLPAELTLGGVGSAPVTAPIVDRGQGVLFVGDANKYFVAAILPQSRTEDDAIQAVRAIGANVRGLRGPEPRVASAALLQTRVPQVGQTTVLRYHTYFGPKIAEEQTAVPVLTAIEKHDRSGFLSVGWLTTALVAVLRLFASLTGSWGVAIILLTLVVRALLFPLNRKSQVAMARFAEKQQILKPKLDDLAKRYKNNPKKLNEEKMKLFKEHGATPPLMGCLPPFLQIPVFVGLFSALRTTYELRQQPFIGWIRDLSRPDELMKFRNTFHVPILGIEVTGLNVLPLLMVVLWIVHQKMMPKPTDPQQAQIQKIMIFMPILFGLMLYNYAAGLSLYMITSSTIGILEQTVIRKYWPPPGAKRASSPPEATVVAVR